MTNQGNNARVVPSLETRVKFWSLLDWAVAKGMIDAKRRRALVRAARQPLPPVLAAHYAENKVDVTAVIIALAMNPRDLVNATECDVLMGEDAARTYEMCADQLKMCSRHPDFANQPERFRNGIFNLIAKLARLAEWSRFPARAPALSDQVARGLRSIKSATRIAAEWDKHIAALQADPTDNVTPLEGARRKSKP
jgi:hypothetical protein